MGESDEALSFIAQGLDLVEKLINAPHTTDEALRRLAGVYRAGASQHLSTRPIRSAVQYRLVLERGIRLWKHLAHKIAGPPGFRSDLAALYAELGELQAGEGQRKAALDSYRQSQALWRDLVQAEPATTRYRAELAGCCERVGRLLTGIGSPDDVSAAYREGLELARQLVHQAPHQVAYQALLAESQGNLGKSLARSNLPDSAILLQQAFESYRQIVSAIPTVPAYRERAAVAAYDCAIHLSECGRPAEAASRLCDAIDLLQRVADDFPDQSDSKRRVARYHYDLGLVWDQAGLRNKAGESYRQALSMRTQLVAKQPLVGRYAEELAWQLATCPHAEIRDPERALELAHLAVELSPSNGNCWKTLGVAQYRTGDYHGARESLERSLEFPISSQAALCFLAMVHWQLGDREKSQACLDAARQWMDQNRPAKQDLLSFRREAEQLLGVYVTPED